MLRSKIERVLRLAKIYGPFVRFDNEGTEGTEGEGNAVDSAIKTAEDAAKTPEEQKAIDEARKYDQLLEQEQANTRRAKAETVQSQTNLETAQTENESLKDQLKAAEAKAAEAGIENVELNEDDYETASDLALVKSIKNLTKKIDAKDAKITALEDKAAGYEKKAKADDAKAASNTAYDELVKDLDDEYGADCHNGAIQKFNVLVADGKVLKGRPEKATRLMEKCYKDTKAEIAKLKAENKKLGLDLDTGEGGGTATNLSSSEIKEGSLDDVADQFATASKQPHI